MKVQIAHPSATPQQIEAHLRTVFPRYSVMMRAGVPIVGDGAATGVMLKPGGPGQMTLVWAFPSMGLQLVLTLIIVLTGLLPGLILFGIVWLTVRGGVARLKQEVATVLTGGAPPQVAPVDPNAPALPPPGGFGPAAAGILFALGLITLIQLFTYRVSSGGILDVVFWIALGVGTLMDHGDRKRAYETRVVTSGPGLWIVAVAALLHGLHGLSYLSMLEGLSLVRTLVANLVWIGIGGVLIALKTRKAPLASATIAPAVFAAGAVFVLLGLLTAFDVYELIDRGVDFELPLVAIALRGLLCLGLGGVVLARGAALRSAPVVASPQQYPQQQYPQQQYPQQQYPQQQYPQQQYPQQWPGPDNKQ